MTDEQVKILQMLAEHKVTAEQAERMLAALGETQDSQGRQRAEQTIAKLGTVLGRLAAGHARDAGPGPSAQPAGQAAGSERPLEILPGAELRVRMRGGNLRVAQCGQGQTPRVRSSRGDAPEVRHEGDVYVLEGNARSGSLEVVVPVLKSLDLSVMGGNAVAEGPHAAVIASIHGGNLTLLGCAGTLHGKCMGGDVSATGRISGLELKCTGGTVRVEELDIREGQHAVECMGGRVRLVIAPSASLTVQASAFGGGIVTDAPAESTGWPGRMQQELKFGEGRAILVAKAFGGDVEVRRAVAR